MRRLLALALFLTALPAFAAQKKVVFFISEGFWAPEYYEPRAAFDKAGFAVTVAGKYADAVRPDRRQWEKYQPVKPDVTFEKVDVGAYDAVVFAGGNGAWEDFFPNEDVHRVLKDAMTGGKLTALLCSSTGLLGIVDNVDGRGKPLAEGRRVTGYYRVEGLLRMGKVKFDPGEKNKPHVVIDGALITGRDPSSAVLFGETVVKALGAPL